MKNLNIAKLLICLSILFIISVNPSEAETHLDIGSISSPNDFELLYEAEEILFESESMSKAEAIPVEIVDQNFNIIAFGNENDDRIEKLIHKSDLITEITGKKYFRLCYETE